MRNLTPVLLLPLVLGGCESTKPTSMSYLGPVRQTIQNTATVKEPFDVVWSRLIEKLAGDFFVMNNADKASRIINLSFKANPAIRFVDCGTTKRVFVDKDGNDSVTTYETAGNARYSVNQGSKIYTNDRKTALSGRADIVVKAGKNETTVSVTAKYTFTTTYEVFNEKGKPIGIKKSTAPARFTTGSPYLGDVITCRSNGSVEKRILSHAMGKRQSKSK